MIDVQQLSQHGPLTYYRDAGIPASRKPVFNQWSHLLSYGQSLSTGTNSTPPQSTTQPYNNLTFGEGPRSTKDESVGDLGGMESTTDLIENTLHGTSIVNNHGETHCSGWANGLIETQVFQQDFDYGTGHVYFSTSNGRGSTNLVNLSPGGSTDDGEWYVVVEDSITEAKARATAAAKSYSMPILSFIQGEGDNADNDNDNGVYLSNLTSLMNSIISHYHTTNSSSDAVWVGVYQTYARTLRTRPHATIDQLAYAESGGNTFLVTPIYHISLAFDGHFSALGSYWYGRYLAKKSKRILDGFQPTWIKTPTATLVGNKVTVSFPVVPVKPLRFLEDGHLKATTNNGFAVYEDDSALTITAVEISGEDKVEITLSTTPTGVVKVRYGLDYLPTGNFDYSGSAGGNLCDSDPASFVYPGDGETYPLYNVAPHFEVAIT